MNRTARTRALTTCLLLAGCYTAFSFRLVHLQVTERAGAQTLIAQVEDSGPGISAEERNNLFAPFVQASAGLKAGGTGLGLSISRQFAELMRGELTLESAPGKGSCFRLTLPIETSAARELPATSPAPLPAAAENPIALAQAFAGLDSAVLEQLAQAVSQARYLDIVKAIEIIRLRSPEVGSALETLAKNFDYDRLLALLPQGTHHA